MTLSFGAKLRQLREERRISKYALESMSGVAHANIFRVEKGERGVPEFQTVFDLAIGLGLSLDERKDFMEQALWERMLDELQTWAIYYLLAIVTDEDLERIVRAINSDRKQKNLKDLLGQRNLELDRDRAFDVLFRIADDPDLRAEREVIAALLVSGLTISLQDGSVDADLGPLVGKLSPATPLQESTLAARRSLEKRLVRHSQGERPRRTNR